MRPGISQDLAQIRVRGDENRLALGLGIPTVPRYLTEPLGGTPFQFGLAVAMFGVTAILARPLVAIAASRFATTALLALGSAVVGPTSGTMILAHSFVAVVLLRALAELGEAFFRPPLLSFGRRLLDR